MLEADIHMQENHKKSIQEGAKGTDIVLACAIPQRLFGTKKHRSGISANQQENGILTFRLPWLLCISTCIFAQSGKYMRDVPVPQP